MTEQPTICITIPGLRGECWVFLDPSADPLPVGRQFATHDQAIAFAQDLATETNWQIEDAGEPPVPIAFDARQASINEQLWLMTTLVHGDEIGWSDSLRPTEIAREIAGILVDGQATINESDLGMLTSIGAVMLKWAAMADEMDNVDDVLPEIMVVDER